VPAMTEPSDTTPADDPFQLGRFLAAQAPIYNQALDELRQGQKRSHWMWYIFPQIDGLGHSATTRHYAIKSIEEARRYLAHPVLGPRLTECAEALLSVRGRSASQIMGYPDDRKLQSSMTLFETVAGPGSVFGRVLDRYYNGERDRRTLEILESLQAS
jgi:uncharacterized protein (DUF1810 family)